MQKHKKFILFQFMCFYPRGGLNDLTGSYDSIEEAKAVADFAQYDYVTVVDRDSWEIVFSHDATA